VRGDRDGGEVDGVNILVSLAVRHPIPHAEQSMRDLGITYDWAECSSVGEYWRFYNCQNVPDVLPDHISKEPTE
jgi:hypothetical protein